MVERHAPNEAEISAAWWAKCHVRAAAPVRFGFAAAAREAARQLPEHASAHWRRDYFAHAICCLIECSDGLPACEFDRVRESARLLARNLIR